MSLSGQRRLAMFLSFLWMGVWLVLSSLDEVFRGLFFLVVGVAPVALIWGIDWVVAGFRRNDPK